MRHFIFTSLFVLLNLSSLLNAEPNLILYKKQNINNGKLLTLSNIKTSGFSFTENTILIIHGFNTHSNKTYWISFKNVFLKTPNDDNIVVVDWSDMAGGILSYSKAVSNTKVVGKEIAQFITNAGINPMSVHCVGHSLGAHACGFIGKQVKIKRISGLDPAGPSFYDATVSERLDKADANLVDVIHTSAKFGLQKSIGHKDFYPNGGTSQPGCGILSKKRSNDDDFNVIDEPEFDAQGKLLNPVNFVKCSHDRARDLFADSLISKCTYRSTPCDSYDNFKNGKCKCDLAVGCSSMGFFADGNNQEGSFYLDTGKEGSLCLD